MPQIHPLIAVTSTTEVLRNLPRVRVNQLYTDALQRAGMIPVVVPTLDPGLADALLQRVDGVVFTGGEDVDAHLYGQTPHPTAEAPNLARDRWEIALAHAAHDRHIPTLAICRGVQVINIALGGSLIQDIASREPAFLTHTRSDDRAHRVHDLSIDPDTRLARAIAAPHITINSSHHQSVDTIGAGLHVVARSSDGVVEGVESNGDDWWMLGVQWHPEELVQTPEPWDRDLFDAFSAAVRASTALALSRPPSNP